MVDTYFMSNDNQLVNMWEFIFTDNPYINFQVKSVNIPFDKFTVESKKDGSKFYTGRDFVSEISLEIYEMADLTTYGYFRLWEELIYNKEKKVFRSTTKFSDDRLFVKQGVLTLLKRLPAGAFNPNMFINLKNLKLLSLSDLALNYESGDALTYTVTMAPESITYGLPGV